MLTTVCKCGWKIKTALKRTIKCPQCNRIVDCDGSGLSRQSWPLWVKGVALLANKDDVGVGDTIYRQAQLTGAESISAWLKDKGFDCGCDARRESFNAKYSYAPESD